MAAHQPDMVLESFGWDAPMSSWPDDESLIRAMIVPSAQKMNTTLVMANSVSQILHGPLRNHTFGGWSLAVDPHGNIMVDGADRNCDTPIATVRLRPR